MNRYRYQFSLTCIALWLMTGCSQNELVEVDLPIPADSAGVMEKANQTQTVRVARADARSPAEEIYGSASADATPAEICRRFLRELNRENPDQFKLYLTSAALNVSSRLKFDLPPVAEANERFELSAPRFASIRNNVCYIDSRIGDDQQKITWMLRQTEAGWRIAGMLVPGKDNTLNLLSFENSYDIAQIRDSLAEETRAEISPAPTAPH